MPKSNLSIYEKVHDVVQAMSRSGRVVSLPFDLRVGFARYVARANISAIKRYAIAPVFRERIAVQVLSPPKSNLLMHQFCEQLRMPSNHRVFLKICCSGKNIQQQMLFSKM